MMRSNVRITQLLVRPAGMGNGTRHSRSDLLGILPQRARRMVSRARPPFGLALGQFRLGQLYVKCPDGGVDLDDVTVAQQCDRPADGCLRSDMADTEATRRA